MGKGSGHGRPIALLSGGSNGGECAGVFYAFTTINYAARGGIATTRFVDPSENKPPADATRTASGPLVNAV